MSDPTVVSPPSTNSIDLYRDETSVDATSAYQSMLSANSTPVTAPGTNNSPAVTNDRLIASRIPVFEPVRAGDNKQAAEFVRNQRSYIFDAARQYNVAPEVIGAVLFEESRHAGALDRRQDAAARAWVQSDPRTASGQKAFQNWLVASNLNTDRTSYGQAQMQLRTAKHLIDSGTLKTPNGVSGVTIPTQTEWRAMSPEDQDRFALGLLVDNRMTPYLVGARARDTINYWKANGGADLEDPTALQEGNSVVNTNHYRILTQLYSTGRTGRGSDTGPVASSDNTLRRFDKVNESGQHAIANFPLIEKALYSNEPFYGFDGELLPVENGGLRQ